MNHYSDNSKLECKLHKGSNLDFKLLLITWNMMGKLPSQKTLEILLTPQRTTADIIVIGIKVNI
jgi:hypothetical protein